MPADLRIHIAPVGFEFRRVTEPLIDMRADKVYLVRYRETDIAAGFYAKISGELRSRFKHIQIENVNVDIWDLYECIEEFRRIILDEKGNRVYINVSTGTKITAIAGMLSCMMWNAHPYYAPVSYTKEPETDKTELVRTPKDLPVYGINKPNPEFMLILQLLREKDGPMRKSLLIEKLEEVGIINETDNLGKPFSSPAKHSRLRSLLDPMERDWNLISVKAHGRISEVSIEPQGERALRIFGLDEENTHRLGKLRRKRGSSRIQQTA